MFWTIVGAILFVLSLPIIIILLVITPYGIIFLLGNGIEKILEGIKKLTKKEKFILIGGPLFIVLLIIISNKLGI